MGLDVIALDYGIFMRVYSFHGIAFRISVLKRKSDIAPDLGVWASGCRVAFRRYPLPKPSDFASIHIGSPLKICDGYKFGPAKSRASLFG
jgi:hypothetical protein